MRTADQIRKDVGIQYSDMISSSTMVAIEMAINEARKEAIEKCAELCKPENNSSYPTIEICSKILFLLNELK